MRTWLAVVLFVLCGAGMARADDNWTSFTDGSATVSLKVPQPPVYSSDATTAQNGGRITNATYMIDLGSMALLALVGDFTGMNIDPANALDLGVKGAQSEGRTLMSDQAISLDGHPGRYVTLTDTDGFAITDRIFFFGDHLYQVITVTAKDATPDQLAMATRFSASLHFLH